VKQLKEGLASPQPFRKVLEPAPELPLRVRVAALRHCWPRATDSTLRRAVKDKGQALLTALRSVRPGHGPTPKTAERKRPAPSRSTAKAVKRQQCVTAEERLGPMLAEAARAEAEQERFLSAQHAEGPESAAARPQKRRKCQKGAATQLCDGFPATLRCCACNEAGLPASMVPCNFAMQKVAYARRATKSWVKAAATMRRGKKRSTPSREAYVTEKLREVAKEVDPHVFCASCLRTYLMGTTVHGGDLHKMFCPGCTKLLRDSAEVAHGGWHWCEECREFHFSSDEFDMTGLGLDGIRIETGMRHIQPLGPELLARVLGPMDQLRLRDVADSIVDPPRVAHGLLKALRLQGARRCSFCGQAQVVDGGCNAVLCESCGLVFDWDAAKPV